MLRSILDTDLYKLTMQQAVLEKYPQAEAVYHFTNRNKTPFPGSFEDQLVGSLMAMGKLSLSPGEATWLHEACPWLKPGYIEYLRNYRFHSSDLLLKVSDGDLRIKIAGPWHRTILWEVPLMAVISELYFKLVETGWEDDKQEEKIIKKGELFQAENVTFSDFGTRRRRSYESQDRVVRLMKKYSVFSGTSNVHLAHKHGVKPIGTMAHEWIMAHAAISSQRFANRYALNAWNDVYRGDLGIALTDTYGTRYALNAWNDVYRGDLGIALTDTYGTEAFYKDFDGVLARLYDGVRHDSANPFEFAERAVKHYKSLGMDPAQKIVVFSDSLDPMLAVQLTQLCRKLGIRSACGIGTNLTNDYDIGKPLNMVIKLRSLNGIEVVKLSDDLRKATGDKDAVRVAKWTFFGTPLDKEN